MFVKTSQTGLFHQGLITAERTRHADRLAELNRLEGLVALFEPYFQKLAARGLHVATNVFHCSHNLADAMHIALGHDWRKDVPLYHALIELGFKEVSRDGDGSYYCIVALTHGQLRLSMTLPHDLAPPAMAIAGSADVCTPKHSACPQEVPNAV